MKLAACNNDAYGRIKTSYDRSSRYANETLPSSLKNWTLGVITAILRIIRHENYWVTLELLVNKSAD